MGSSPLCYHLSSQDLQQWVVLADSRVVGSKEHWIACYQVVLKGDHQPFSHSSASLARITAAVRCSNSHGSDKWLRPLRPTPELAAWATAPTIICITGVTGIVCAAGTACNKIFKTINDINVQHQGEEEQGKRT